MQKYFVIVILVLAGTVSPAAAQVFANLHNFTKNGGGSFTNFDGAEDVGGLVLSGTTLFGAAEYGGSANCGTIFRVNQDGSAFTNLYNFTNGPDGTIPEGTLVLSGNTLYGTTFYGGASANGGIFRINTDGTGFTNLYSFTAMVNSTNGDGANPYAALTVTNGMLYGTAVYGGRFGGGTIFGIGTNGLNFTNLHNFTALINGTNGDGTLAYAPLLLAGTNVLYGLAYAGGVTGDGTFFRVGVTGGATFTNLYTFNGYGSGPFGGLVLVSNLVYGTAYGGGYGYGAVFCMDTNGARFNPLHTFQGSDGGSPKGTLALAGNVLYGTASTGGTANNGTVFALNTDGTGFESLYSFSAPVPILLTNRDGYAPYSGVVVSSNVVYGSAYYGGLYANGTLYSVLVEPTLTIARAGTNMVVTWPTNFPGYNLQSATNLAASPVSWSAVTGQYDVTNAIFPAKQKFYRLVNP